MSDTNETETNGASAQVQLAGLFAFKQGMATIYTEQGEAIPVTVLKYEPWTVSQVKTKEKDGYEAVQIACRPTKAKNTKLAKKNHLKAAGFENGAQLVRELRGPAEGAQIGAKVDIGSLKKGDVVKLTGVSKGRGFTGSVKRHNFAGGPASHGSKFHRQPGSSGNRTWPGRVMPGKKFPGHFGDETITVRNVMVVEVSPEENVVLVKGPVPGARNSLVRLVRE